MLALVRKGRDVCWVEPEGEMEPLVTVAIPTFERPELIERAIASAQAQTYERLDLLVVGDHTDSRSERLVRSIIDSDPGCGSLICRDRGAIRAMLARVGWSLGQRQ